MTENVLMCFSAKIVSEKTDVSAPDSEESSTTVPKRSSFVGTAQYVSPEILTNRGRSYYDCQYTVNTRLIAYTRIVA